MLIAGPVFWPLLWCFLKHSLLLRSFGAKHSTLQLKKKLALEQLEGVKWHIEGAVATTGTGLFEGLDWLAENLPNAKDAKKKAKEEAKSSQSED